MAYQAGDFVAPFKVTNLQGAEISIPSRSNRFLHLQFRRFAGCPVCNLHLRTLARDHDKFVAADIRQVIVVASKEDEVAAQMGKLPFDFVSDQERKLYERFAVKSSLMATLHPVAMAAAAQGVFMGANPLSGMGSAFNILPAEFLIGPSGKVLACKFSRHAADQWNANETLALAAQFADT